MSVRSVVLGVGSALPKRKVTNAELSESVDTTDQWIVDRTGIRSRYVAADGTFQVIVDLQESKDNVPDFLVNRRTLFVGSGNGRAFRLLLLLLFE